MEEKKINTRIVFSIVAVLLLIAVVAGATYAYFSATASSAAQTVTTATMDLAFDDSTAIINATNITPMYQSEIETKAAKKSFTVTNNGTQNMYLKMQLTDIVMDDELKDLWFRWALYEDGTRIGIGSFYEAGTEVFMQQNMVIEPGTANAKNYDLYIWIEDSDEDQNIMQGKTFSGKITVNGSMTEYEGALLTVSAEYLYDDDYTSNFSESEHFATNITTLSWNNKYNYYNATYNGEFTKLTNLKSISLYGGHMSTNGYYPTLLPISLESISGFGNMEQLPDFRYLSNLKSISISYISALEDYCYTNSTIYLPKSLEKLGELGFGCGDSFKSKVETHDFSYLVNLKTVEAGVFRHLTSEDTVILPASIKDTVTFDIESFGTATIVYQ